MPANPYNLPPTARLYECKPIPLDITPSQEAYAPETFEDAVAYLLEQGLSEINAYAGRGYERFRRYAAEELVSSYFPHLAPDDLAESEPQPSLATEPMSMQEVYTRTHYAVQRTPALRAVAEVAMVDAGVKVG